MKSPYMEKHTYWSHYFYAQPMAELQAQTTTTELEGKISELPESKVPASSSWGWPDEPLQIQMTDSLSCF